MQKSHLSLLWLSIFVGLSLLGLSACRSSSPNKLEPFFLQSFESAKQVARSQNKPMIAVFSASWCPPCQKMRQEVYPSEELKPYRDQFVWVYLDVDLRGHQKLLKQYQVEVIPHFVVLSPEGELLLQSRGALDLQGMIETLQTASKLHRGEEPGRP